MMFERNLFPVKNTTTTNTHSRLHRQNAWSEQDLIALLDYSKNRQ